MFNKLHFTCRKSFLNMNLPVLSANHKQRSYRHKKCYQSETEIVGGIFIEVGDFESEKKI